VNHTPTTSLNLTKLTDLLWTGGDLPEPAAEARKAIEAWQALGIGAVIDNRIEWNDEERVTTTAPELGYLHAGVDDAGQVMPDWWFDTVTAFALRHIEQGSGVLVHCHMGINRGPSAAFAVLLASWWDPIDAIDLIRTSRPIAAVAYAEDALDWWQRQTDMCLGDRADESQRLSEWRRSNPHDTLRIMRDVD
jgi:dual specificity phosphatase 3